MLGKLNRYVKKVSVFLITVALIVGMAGCGPVQYNLTISSTEGGEVTTPGEGMFTYDEGTIVDLVAEADQSYQFVNWTGNVNAVADVNAAATNITMNGHYSITANFAIATEIWDWYDLDALRDNLRGNHILMNDLDSTTAGYEELASPTANEGKGWEPIGTWMVDFFTGTFDGQGHKIQDLYINRPGGEFIGLFCWVGEGGIVKNVGVVEAAVSGVAVVGGLVGANSGTVSNCYATGSVTGEEIVGGLVGVNGGTEVGILQGTVSDSYSTGSVTGTMGVGGLVGINGGPVINSYSTGSVTGNISYVGGLIGWSEGGIVTNSFWDTETSGQATSAGGTGKNTTEMQDITTFSGVGWNIIAVGGSSERNPSYIWNIVDDETYPFLSWQAF